MKLRICRFLFIVALIWFGVNILGCTEAILPQHRGAVSGRVYDSNQLSIAGAIITSHRSLVSAETDSNGRYSFTSLDIGSHRFTIERNGYYLGSATVQIEGGESIENFDIKVEAYEKMIDHKVSVLEQTRAVITVDCYEPMALTVSWCLDGSARIQNPATEYDSTHRIELVNLYSGSDYKYFITGVTKDGRKFIAEDGSFRTLHSGGMAGDPDAPSVVTVSQSVNGPVITWQYTGMETPGGFRVYRAVSDGEMQLLQNEQFIFGNENSYVDSSAIPGQVYRYAVMTVDLDGNSSSLSESVSIVPGGTLVDNVTWKLSQSPIRIDGDIIVPEFYSLVVEPGVTVTFNQTDNGVGGYDRNKCEVIVQGCLYAIGTEEQPIRFISGSSVPTRNDWSGIRIVKTDNQTPSVIKNTVISGANVGIELYETVAEIASVTTRYCDKGIKLNNCEDVSISGFNAEECNMAFYAVSTKNCSLKEFNALNCKVGTELAGNQNFMLQNFDFRGISSKGLTVTDRSDTVVKNGVIQCENLGIEIGSSSGDYEYLTLDCLNGIIVSSGNAPTIKNNIVVNNIYSGRGNGIEDKTSGHSYPYNNIYGFLNAVKSCSQSGAAIQNVNPQFMGGSGVNYDYHLQSTSPVLNSSETGSQLGAYGG